MDFVHGQSCRSWHCNFRLILHRPVQVVFKRGEGGQERFFYEVVVVKFSFDPARGRTEGFTN